MSGGLQGQAVDLALHELAVQTVLAHQTVGGAVLNCLAELQHDDAVEIPDRGEPMGNGDHRASAHQAAQGFADRFLRLAVERGGCLVEQKERRVRRKSFSLQ